MDIEGVLIVNNSGNFSCDNDIDIDDIARLEVNGNFTLMAELNHNGYFYNSGFSVIEYFHNDGYCCNTGTIKSPDRVYNHGGTIECGGTILTCEFDMADNNNAVDITGDITAKLFGQNVCCENPNNPNPFDELNGDWYIDSSTVSICTLDFEPNAGDDSQISTCQSVGSFIDLNTFLSTDANPGGVFAELTASGAFNPATGMLFIDNLIPGIYSFTYTVNGYDGATDVSNIEITLNPTLNSSESLTICDNQLPYEWNGVTFNNPSSQTVTLTSLVTGCDSMATLTLSVSPTLFSNTDTVLCDYDLPFEWNGLIFTEAGSQTSTLLSSSGCDSLATLNLSLNTVLTSTTEVAICDSELPYVWNDLSVESAGSYSATFTSPITGCDSIATLNIEVDILEVPELISSGPVACPKDIVDVSVSEIAGAEFYWEGPMDFTSSEPSNSFELDYDNSGLYSVYYILNSCVSETAYTELMVESAFDFKNFDFPNVITANGDGVNDEIDINQYIGECEEFELTVRDRWGNQVYLQRRGDAAFDGNSILNEMLPEGVYFYKFTHSQGSSSGFIHLMK